MPEKCFNFEAQAKCKMKGYVFANNIEEAKTMIKNNTIDGESIIRVYGFDPDTIHIVEDTEYGKE